MPQKPDGAPKWACPNFLDRDFWWLFMAVNPFKVHRRLIAQSAVEAFWVIEGFNIIKDSQAGLVVGSEVFCVKPFCFESAPE